MRGRLASAHVDDPILENAQQAVDALRAGMDLRNVVIRCYFQMALALQEKHGIQLEATMTAREFERLLEYEGFPVAPVHQLTSLFEKVRYSSQDTITQADEAMALASLNAIIRAGSQGRGGSDE